MAVIAHYKLNDNAASATVLDATGSYNGTYKDAGGNENTSAGSSANSRGVGTCIDFDHANSEYVEVADNAVFTPALTPFSISAWCYMHDATNFMLASKGVVNTDFEWLFYVEGSDLLAFIVGDESVADCYIGRNYNSALTSYQNTWIHIVATYSGGTVSASVKLYLNALRVDNADSESNPGSFVSAENLTHAVWVGRYSTAYANGLIDNVIIFNHELHEDQVKALYNGGHGTEIVADIDIDRRIKRR